MLVSFVKTSSLCECENYYNYNKPTKHYMHMMKSDRFGLHCYG